MIKKTANGHDLLLLRADVEGFGTDTEFIKSRRSLEFMTKYNTERRPGGEKGPRQRMTGSSRFHEGGKEESKTVMFPIHHDLVSRDHRQESKMKLNQILILLICCVLLIGQPVAFSQQWATNSNNTDIHNANSGNVGIGTDGADPAEKLEVPLNPGNIKLGARTYLGATYSSQGTVLGNAVKAELGTNFNRMVESVGDSIGASALNLNEGIISFHTKGGYTTAGAAFNWERMRIDANGNVGIATSVVNAKLDVNFNGAFFRAMGDGSSQDKPSGFVSRIQDTSESTPLHLIYAAHSDPLRSNELMRMHSNETGSGSKVLRITGGSTVGSPTREILTATTAGNVGIGTATPDSTKALHVVGDVKVDGDIAARYQDIAEWVSTSAPVKGGTVVILDSGRHNAVMPSFEAYDTRVAGVVSEHPGVILGEAAEGKAKIATTGRVKVRVDATNASIQIGDLLVTSGKSGVAMRSEPLEVAGVKIHRPGTLIGKALEPLDSGQGEILVLLSLQ